MNDARKEYERPELSRVRFEDKDLVAFHTCRKQTALAADEASCCNVQGPFGNQFNLNDLDPS